MDWQIDSEAAPRFSWREVNCFTRPQSLLCERVASGSGLLFLFLESFYRAWGLDGNFCDRRNTHFRFTSRVLPEVAGLEFRLTVIEHPDAVLGQLRELLTAGAVLVPTNLRDSRFGRPDEDTAHYFIITGFENPAGCRVFDCLHNTDRESIPVYGPASLSFDVIEALVQSYWRSYVTAQLPTHHSEQGYWLLQVLPIAARRSALGDIETRIIRTYTQAFASSGVRCSRASFFDTRNLLLVHRCLEEGRSLPASMMRGYLAEANDCNVHLRVLSHAARTLRQVNHSSLERSIQKHVEDSMAVRTEAMVRCLARTRVDSTYLEEVADRLWSSALRLRAEVIEQLHGLG